MRHFKHLFLSLLLSGLLLYTGCESNDALQDPSPQPPVTDTLKKKVIIEFFTNAGCNPCIAAHNYLDAIHEELGQTIRDSNVIILSYHTRYPFIGDVLYLANVPHNQGRSNYYGVTFTPQGKLNGVDMGQFSESNWTAQFNAQLLTNEFLQVDLSNTFNAAIDSGTVTINTTLINALPSSEHSLHVVITENNIPYPNAPNGITSPDDVMRFMITGLDGEVTSFGQSNTIVKNYGLNPSWNEDECNIVVFIQNTATKQIFGVNKIKVKEYYSN
jgi:hypothetical protein